jgi:signal peptidase I
MKKWIWVCIVGGVLFWTWVGLRLTHSLEYYSVSSPSNLPTLHPGEIFFASCLKKPAYNNFICFKLPDEKSAWMFRCIGQAGDIIEIRKAVVYRNGIQLKEPYTNNEYYIGQSKLNHIRGYIEQNKNELVPINDTLYKLTLSGNELMAYHLDLPMIVAKKESLNDGFFSDFRKAGYNEDNFGPVKIPAGSYFLLGDNRHDAFDSRYIGFIKKAQIVATVLGH